MIWLLIALVVLGLVVVFVRRTHARDISGHEQRYGVPQQWMEDD